jgi:BirA family transcriptional regulator, biotin operon repressor / biotin---[acetyl-CoA-carboxylase] ligase
MNVKNKIKHFNTLDSTNLFLKKNMMALPDKTIVVADQQTKGKGKGSNTWHSTNTNNVYASILLKGTPNLYRRLPELTLFFSIIAANLIDCSFFESSPKAFIKSPNDLFIANKKMGGILAESVFIGSHFLGVVLGIGLNFMLTDLEKGLISQPVTSLSDHFHMVVDRDKWINSLFQVFLDQFEDFIEFGNNLLKDELNKRLFQTTN